MTTQKISRDSLKSNSGGFALLESLISFIILAVGLLALVSFHSASQTNIAEAKAQAEAVAVAEAKLQELESFLTDTDTRLDVVDTTENVAGQLATYTLNWTVVDASANLKTVTVTVGWNDRNGDAQQVILSSDIHFSSPTEGVENFIAVLEGTEEIRENYETGGDGNPWVVPGTDDITGQREIVERVSNELYEGYIPDDYAYNNVYIFRIFVSGSITRSQGASTDEIGVVDADALAVESIEGNAATYVPYCTTGNGTYACTLYYLSTLDGWTGSIAFTLNEGDVFCSSGFSQLGSISITLRNGRITYQYTGVKAYSNLLESTTFDIVIAGSFDNC